VLIAAVEGMAVLGAAGMNEEERLEAALRAVVKRVYR
jgi:hypothetical protein